MSNQENQKPPVSHHQQVISQSPTQKDDDEFVPVSYDDAEDHDEKMNESDDEEDDENPSSPPNYSLKRVPNKADTDEEEAEQSNMLHPLMGHLQNRLMGRSRSTPNRFHPLHPYTNVLSIRNLDECVRVEEEAFPENERCSRRRFEYRLKTCPELSLGIFSRPTLSEAAESKDPVVPELLGHIVATRTNAPCVTDKSMRLPKLDTQMFTLPETDSEDESGHTSLGATVCIHSLAIGAAHQQRGLGTVLLKAYTQRIKDAKCAERIALLAHAPLVKFYTRHGFEDMGPSQCVFGEGEWRNMIMDLTKDNDDSN